MMAPPFKGPIASPDCAHLGNCSTTLAHTASSDSLTRISGLSTVRSWLSWTAESDIVPDNMDDVMGLGMELLFRWMEVRTMVGAI